MTVATAPLREFLTWLAFSPRTYGETMEAWASHCPRFLVWEDALAAGLVSIGTANGPFESAPITLTPAGVLALAAGD